MLHDSTGKTANRAGKRVALVVTSASSFTTPFMGSAVNIALPSVGTEFSLNAVLLGWVATSYLLAAVMFLLPFGRMADIYGRKKMFIWGFFVYAIASLLCAMSPSAVLLIAARVLQGIGAAMIFGTGVAILTSVFPASERGRALGINVGAVYLGLSLGPVLGGVLTENLGWRSIFSINAALGLIIIVLVFWKLKGEWAEARGERFDLAGSIVYCIAMVAIMYGFSLLPDVLSIWLVLIGVAGLVVFILWEERAKSPVFHVNLFRKNPVFLFSNLAALINYSATFAVAFILSLYLQYIKELSPQVAGLVLVAQPAMQAIFSPFAGRLSDRVEPRIVASAGMALTFVGLGLLAFITAGTTLPFIVFSLMLLGFGFALFSSPNTNAVMSAVEKKFYGVASATLGTMRLSGQMFSMGIVMVLLTIYIGRVEISPQYYPAFIMSAKLALIIFAVLCFAGVFLSLARGRVRQNS